MFGPDGKPINLGSAINIGGPKSLEDIPVFPDATIDEMAAGMDGMIKQGTPLEVPAAMPLLQLAGVARTMVVLRDRVKELEARVLELEEPGDDSLLPRLPDSSTRQMPLLAGLNMSNGRLNLGDITGDTGE
jgi:hypothetical protein